MLDERYYSEDDICELLTKAAALGFSLDKGSELEKLSLEQLDVLVNRKM